MWGLFASKVLLWSRIVGTMTANDGYSFAERDSAGCLQTMPSIGDHACTPGRAHRLLPLPHEPVCMRIGGLKMGKVGIFWFYEGIPLLVTVPLQHGIDDGDFINSQTTICPPESGCDALSQHSGL